MSRSHFSSIITWCCQKRRHRWRRWRISWLGRRKASYCWMMTAACDWWELYEEELKALWETGSTDARVLARRLANEVPEVLVIISPRGRHARS